MKYLISLMMILAVTGSMALAQSSSAWREFTRDGEEFTVAFPEEIKYEELPGPARSVNYWSRAEQVRVFIASEARNSHPILDQAMNIIAGYGMTETEISSIPAKRYRRTDDRFVYGAVTVSTEGRSYFFFAVAPLGNEDDVNRFLESVRIDPKAILTNETSIETPKSAEKSTKPNFDQKSPFGAGRSGTTSPFGAGRSSTEVPPPTDPMSRPQSDNSGVRILSKPRPSYNDIARLFRIDGSVTLRVTFSADGKIGATTIVSALPFGLTESAIGAARAIRFEPARRDGKPYSVTKVVEYTFTLY